MKICGKMSKMYKGDWMGSQLQPPEEVQTEIVHNHDKHLVTEAAADKLSLIDPPSLLVSRAEKISLALLTGSNFLQSLAGCEASSTMAFTIQRMGGTIRTIWVLLGQGYSDTGLTLTISRISLLSWYWYPLLRHRVHSRGWKFIETLSIQKS